MNLETLRQHVEALEVFSTDGYEMWGNRIDESSLTMARRLNNLNAQEHIFFVSILSDGPFWSSVMTIVVATEKGLSVTVSGLPVLHLPWKDIDNFDVLSEKHIRVWAYGKLYTFQMFQNGTRDEYSALLNELINEDTSAYKGEATSLQQTSMAKTSGGATESAPASVAACDKLLRAPLTSLESQYAACDYSNVAKCDYCGIVNTRSRLLAQLGKTDQAKEDLVGFIEKCHEPGFGYSSDVYFDACMLLCNLCLDCKELDRAIIFVNMAAGIEDPERQRSAREQLQHVQDLRARLMASSPPAGRQMVLCTNEIPTQPVKEFGFANADALQTSGWKFEIGHPQTGEIYVCHPLRPDVYYSVQSFHDRLFDEKRTELVYLLESIGARHVHVEAVTDTSIEMQRNAAYSGKVSDEVLTGATVGIERETHQDAKQTNQQTGVEDRELNPAAHPHIPSDLVWYPHETSWQRIAQAALGGRYKTLSVELRYQEDFSVNQKRMTQVQGDLKMFAGNIEVGWKADTENNLRLRKATSWKYTAAFDEGTVDRKMTETQPLSEAETEYLDDVTAALADGVLAESTRRILERQRVRLGISPERALELEQSVSTPVLSDEEKEYLEDLSDAYTDGVISDSSRRILARRREKLGLSIERALEIEKILGK